MKKIYLILLGILLVGTVIAVGSLVNRIIVVPDKPVGLNGVVTFEFNETQYGCYFVEYDNMIQLDDIQRCARKLTIPKGSEISNICDWNNNCLKPDENHIGQNLNK